MANNLIGSGFIGFGCVCTDLRSSALGVNVPGAFFATPGTDGAGSRTWGARRDWRTRAQAAIAGSLAEEPGKENEEAVKRGLDPQRRQEPAKWPIRQNGRAFKKNMSSEDTGYRGDRLAPWTHAGRSNYPHSTPGELTVPQITPLRPVRLGKFRFQKGAAVTCGFARLRLRRQREKNPVDTLKMLIHAWRALRHPASILSTSVSGTSRRWEITTDSILRWRMARLTHPRGEAPLVKGIAGHLQTFEPWVATGCDGLHLPRAAP